MGKEKKAAKPEDGKEDAAPAAAAEEKPEPPAKPAKLTKEDMVAKEEELAGLEAKLVELGAKKEEAIAAREATDAEVAAEKATTEAAEAKAATAKAAADAHRDGMAAQAKRLEDTLAAASARTAELDAESESLAAQTEETVAAHSAWSTETTAAVEERDATHAITAQTYMGAIEKLRAALASADADVASVRAELTVSEAAAVDAAMTQAKESERLAQEISELDSTTRKLSKQTSKTDDKSRHWQMLYKVRTECDVKGFFNRDISHHQQLVVQQRMMSAITGIQTTAEEAVTCCCCFNKGSASLSARADKNAYVPGEVAQVICNIANRSEEGFSRVSIELKRRLTLRSNGGARHYSTDVVARQDYAGVQANEVRDESNPLMLALPLNGPAIYPSVESRLIHCDYIIDVIFRADGTFVSNLHVKVPITVYAPQPPPTVWVQQVPPGWNPQVMPGMQVQIPQINAAMLPQINASGPPPQYQAPPPQQQYGNDRTPLLAPQGQPIMQQPQGMQQGMQQGYGGVAPQQQQAPQQGGFDPMSGQPVMAQSTPRFDPMTGKPM